MKVFLADLNQLLYMHSDLVLDLELNVLESYYRILLNRLNNEAFMEHEKRPKKIFLDSGAFSAWSKGVDIKIDDYIEFIKKWQSELEIYAVLDVIGDAEATYKSQKYMESKGLHPLPCFHYGEEVEYLKRYLNEDHEFIALGGMVPISNRDLIVWLDEMFGDHLTDDEGWPRVKVHGFGMTSVGLMLRYPWYSVDSTSWVLTSRFGAVLVPYFEDGKWIYNRAPYKIEVSEQSSKAGQDYKHFSTFPKMLQERIHLYFESKGTSYEKLSTIYQERDILNIKYFVDFENNYEMKPFKKKARKQSFKF